MIGGGMRIKGVGDEKGESMRGGENEIKKGGGE